MNATQIVGLIFVGAGVFLMIMNAVGVVEGLLALALILIGLSLAGIIDLNQMLGGV